MVGDGLAVFVRKILKHHGTPADFASRYADAGLRWCLIGGPWHDKKGQRHINDARTCRRYADALAKRGVAPMIWGYSWQGTEELWCSQMRAAAGDHDCACINAELGANPVRSRRPHAMAKANVHAQQLVEGLVAEDFTAVYLSTYGSAARMPWFPMEAFLRNLAAARADNELSWAAFGGQTYVEDRRIDPSIADFVAARDRYAPDRVDLVPGGGLYKFTDATRKKAVPKTPHELRYHLSEFVDELEPVEAIALWAENFLGRRVGQGPLWRELTVFQGWMDRGACLL